MRSGHDDADPVVALRSLMARVRDARETGNTAYAFATVEYEAAAKPINHKFLRGVLDSLPVTGFPNSYSPGDFIVRGGSRNVLPTLALGVTHRYRKNYYSSAHLGFVLGEQAVSRLSTRLLIGGVQPRSGSFFLQTTVNSHAWQTLRDRALSNLTTADPEMLLEMRRSADEYEVAARHVPQLRDDIVVVPRLGNHLNARGTTFNDVRAGDFAKFNIMYHLSVLAAAFGRDQQLQRLAAAREAALPPAPEEAMFGLPDFRAITEQPHF